VPKQLTTQNASITTVAVEVQALTISGKQVTQSVYRQLREARLIAHDGTLNGVPWGFVNHCPERQYWNDAAGEFRPCNNGSAHLHIVWQYGAELYRSRITPPPLWYRPLSASWGDGYAQALYCLNDHNYSNELRQISSGGCLAALFTLDGMHCHASLPDNPRRDGHDCSTVGDLEACRDGLRGDIGREYDRRGKHKALWQSMKELPQLFIAV
jgi:hypothetical protein